MRISFDLDDTLICRRNVPCEPNRVPWLLRRWLNEPLRDGTVDLIRLLIAQGHEIGIYTTSYRSKRRVKLLFQCYGLKLSFIVNQYDHEQAFQGRLNRVATKMPHLFGIDLHVDDDTWLKEVSVKYQFHVIQIEPDDRTWSEKVEQAVLNHLPR